VAAAATTLIPMQIPFADAVLGRLSRNGAGLELIEEIEDEGVDRVGHDGLSQ